MGFFTSYIRSILTVAVCAFICNAVCDGFKGSKPAEKAMAITTSLCIFISVILPIVGLFKGIKEETDAVPYEKGEITSSAFAENLETAAEMHINEIIYKATGTMPQNTSVIISQSNYEIEKISVEIQSGIIEKEKLSKLISSSAGENTIIEITENTK